MKAISSYHLVRLFLNVLYLGLIFWAAITNNRGSEVAIGHVLLYNTLLFVPGWINNFGLLPRLRRNKKASAYFGSIVVVFLTSLLILGQYLHWLQIRYATKELTEFTPLGITSSAPPALTNYQYYFDALPAMIIILITLLVGYVIQEFLVKLKTEKHIQNEQAIAELNLLKSQISPHFLFNVLNSLYALSLSKSDKTPDVILQLSDILRYSLYEAQEREVPVPDEVAIIDTYIAIEKIRIPATTDISFIHSGIDEAKMAPMLLLPLIENAFKHGVDSTVDHSYIHASLHKTGNTLVFTCENTFKASISRSKVGGIGIQNIRKRLELLYPSRHQLEIEQQEGIYKVTLSIKL